MPIFPRTEHERVKSISRNLIIELGLISALVVAVDLLLFPGSLIGWNPSPLWAIVVLVAMRYGSPAGLLAGGMAAGLHLWELTLAGHSFQDLLHRNPELLTGPVLYLFVGMYMGESRERLGRRAEHFRQAVSDLNQKLDVNEIRRLNLERDHLAMEKRIAGQTDTLLDVYENLNRLGAAHDESELWSTLADILQREMRAEACGVWRLSPPELLAVAGAMSEAVPPLAALAVKKRGVATVADWSDRNDEPPEGDLAGFLGEDAERPVVAVVSGIGFAHLNRNAVIYFDLVVQRAGFVLQDLRRLATLRQASIGDPELGLGSESYLRNRIREQMLLAKRHRTALGILCCSFAAEPPAKLAERLEVILACSIRAAVRASDGIAFFPGAKAFVVMLPGSDLDGAGVVMRKIIANLETLDIHDEEGRRMLDLKWNALTPSEDDDDMYDRLFSGMAAVGAAT